MAIARTAAAKAILALLLSAGLSACGGGGGGGNVRETPDPPSPPPPPPPPAPCNDPAAVNYRADGPCRYSYAGFQDNILVPAGVQHARRAGLTGEDVKVGVFDDARITPYAPLDGQVEWYADFTGGKPTEEESAGHGTVVATVIAGLPGGEFSGGVAPGASIYWGRVCAEDACSFPGIGNAFDAMASRGVRLFNLSLGTEGESEDEARESAEAFAFYAQSVLAVDGLVIASSGNEGVDRPAVPAVVPYFEPQYLDNWISVGAVDINSTTGKPLGLASYSNECGVAADWCLVAPGTVWVPEVPGTKFDNGMRGTSAAAPIVSGVAALVWEAFPWMSAHNLQQTLLTTATDMGAPGVDSVYGWGLVNAQKAVQGPGVFSADFMAVIPSGEYSFGNDISGPGGLVLSGNGRLNLLGENSYLGGTRVEGGLLALSGRLASDVDVLAGAGFASFGGRIDGDYSAAAGADTLIQLGTGLEIGGTAALAGRLVLLPEPDDYPVADQERLLSAGAVLGSFDEVSYGSGFFWDATLSYSGTEVLADLTRASVAAKAAALGESAAVVDGGAQTDVLLGFTDRLAGSDQAGQRQALLAAAARLQAAPTAEAGALSLASLTGQLHDSGRLIGLRQALDEGQLLAARARQLGEGGTGLWYAEQTLGGDLARPGYAGADYQQSGLLLGQDWQLGEGLVLGAVLGSGNGHTRMLDPLAGWQQDDRLSLALYGRMDLPAGYLAASLGYARSNRLGERQVLLGTQLHPVTGWHRDSSLNLRLEAGLELRHGLAPFAAVGLLRHTQGAFEETGADGLGLAAGADRLDLGYAELGLRLQRQLGPLQVAGTVSGRQRLSGGDAGYRAWFAGAPEADFLLPGPALPEQGLRAAFDFSWRGGDGWGWYGQAGLEQERGQDRSVFGLVGLRRQF